MIKQALKDATFHAKFCGLLLIRL